MDFKLLVHDAALIELEAAIEWYAKISDELAKNLAKQFTAALNEIEKNYLLNAEIRSGYRKQNMDGFPYKLVYKILSTQILVVAVAHHKRRPGYWRKRK